MVRYYKHFVPYWQPCTTDMALSFKTSRPLRFQFVSPYYLSVFSFTSLRRCVRSLGSFGTFGVALSFELSLHCSLSFRPPLSTNLTNQANETNSTVVQLSAPSFIPRSLHCSLSFRPPTSDLCFPSDLLSFFYSLARFARGHGGTEILLSLGSFRTLSSFGSF